jgi:hypothetical protein
MSDTALTVPDMTEPPSRYEITITVDHGGMPIRGLAEFATAASQAASRRSASIMWAYTARQIVSVVTVYASDRLAAAAIALALVSEALRPVAVSSSR